MNFILENKFYGNEFFAQHDQGLGGILKKSRYILCISNGLYGFEWLNAPKNDPAESDLPNDKKVPIRAALWDIGAHISNLDQNAYSAKGYEFTTCSFHTIDGLTTLFLVFRDKESGKSHYVHLNEDTYDAQYGFREISSLVIEGMDFAVD